MPTPKCGVGLARSQGAGKPPTPAVRIERASRVERQVTGQRHSYLSHRAPLMRRQRHRDQFQPLALHGW